MRHGHIQSHLVQERAAQFTPKPPVLREYNLQESYLSKTSSYSTNIFASDFPHNKHVYFIVLGQRGKRTYQLRLRFDQRAECRQR